MKGHLAVLTNDRHQVFQRAVIAGAQEVADARGCELAVLEVPQGPADLAEAGVTAGTYAGILVVATALPDALLHALADTGRPLTLVSHRLSDADIPSVMHDNPQGMKQLVRHLVEDCGRRNLLFIRGDARQTDAFEREAAFRHEAMRYGLYVGEERYLPGAFEAEHAARALEAFLEAGRPADGATVDGIVSADYLMAIAAMEVLRATGQRVPQDVAVVGFGDGPEAAQAGLTTVAADVVELGRRAGRQLLGQLDGLRIRGQTRLSTTLIARDSSCRG
ncbi:MAG TPA: substrate-binding domain-containing protein [Trueperaceae bacterium]